MTTRIIEPSLIHDALIVLLRHYPDTESAMQSGAPIRELVVDPSAPNGYPDRLRLVRHSGDAVRFELGIDLPSRLNSTMLPFTAEIEAELTTLCSGLLHRAGLPLSAIVGGSLTTSTAWLIADLKLPGESENTLFGILGHLSAMTHFSGLIGDFKSVLGVPWRDGARPAEPQSPDGLRELLQETNLPLLAEEDAGVWAEVDGGPVFAEFIVSALDPALTLLQVALLWDTTGEVQPLAMALEVADRCTEDSLQLCSSFTLTPEADFDAVLAARLDQPEHSAWLLGRMHPPFVQALNLPQAGPLRLYHTVTLDGPLSPALLERHIRALSEKTNHLLARLESRSAEELGTRVRPVGPVDRSWLTPDWLLALLADSSPEWRQVRHNEFSLMLGADDPLRRDFQVPPDLTVFLHVRFVDDPGDFSSLTLRAYTAGFDFGKQAHLVSSYKLATEGPRGGQLGAPITLDADGDLVARHTQALEHAPSSLLLAELMLRVHGSLLCAAEEIVRLSKLL